MGSPPHRRKKHAMTESGTATPGLVVVGVDGSESSLTALRWAAADAVRRRGRLRVLIARAPVADYPNDIAEHVAMLETVLQERADRVVAGVRDVLSAAPDLPAEV